MVLKSWKDRKVASTRHSMSFLTKLPQEVLEQVSNKLKPHCQKAGPAFTWVSDWAFERGTKAPQNCWPLNDISIPDKNI